MAMGKGSSFMMMMSLMIFSGGVILDSVARGRAEQKRFHYMSIPTARGDRRSKNGPGFAASDQAEALPQAPEGQKLAS